MITLRFCGLLNFLVLLSSVPAHPIMGDVDTTITPSSQELTTATSVQEIAITTVEQNSITSILHVEDSDETMDPALIVSTAVTDSVTATTGLITTLSNTTPAVESGLPDTMGLATTPIVMENEIQATESASTTVTPATTSITTVTAGSEHLNEIVKQPDEANSVDVPATTSAPLPETTPTPAVTTTMIMSIVDVDANEIVEHADEKVPVMESAMSQSPSSNVLAETTASPALDLIPTKLNENSVMEAVDEVDNVLTMSSNEDTTRMASPTESKMDAADKNVAPLDSHTESPKLQETKNELEPNGKGGGNSIATSFVVLAMAVLFVIA